MRPFGPKRRRIHQYRHARAVGPSMTSSAPTTGSPVRRAWRPASLRTAAARRLPCSDEAEPCRRLDRRSAASGPRARPHAGYNEQGRSPRHTQKPVGMASNALCSNSAGKPSGPAGDATVLYSRPLISQLPPTVKRAGIAGKSSTWTQAFKYRRTAKGGGDVPERNPWLGCHLRLASLVAEIRRKIIGDGLRFIGRGGSAACDHVGDNDRPIRFVPSARYAFEVVA